MSKSRVFIGFIVFHRFLLNYNMETFPAASLVATLKVEKKREIRQVDFVVALFLVASAAVLEKFVEMIPPL